jgi:hypothetical protein
MLNIHVGLPSDCLTRQATPYLSTLDCFAPRAPAARLWRKQGSPVRAPDKAAFDNSAPTTRAWRQPALACRSGLRQGCYAHFSAGVPPGRSRSLVRTCIKELEAAGAAFLSSPPLFFRWPGKCSFPGAYRAFRASFFRGLCQKCRLDRAMHRVDCNSCFGSRTKGAQARSQLLR